MLSLNSVSSKCQSFKIHRDYLPLFFQYLSHKVFHSRDNSVIQLLKWLSPGDKVCMLELNILLTNQPVNGVDKPHCFQENFSSFENQLVYESTLRLKFRT